MVWCVKEKSPWSLNADSFEHQNKCLSGHVYIMDLAVGRQTSCIVLKVSSLQQLSLVKIDWNFSLNILMSSGLPNSGYCIVFSLKIQQKPSLVFSFSRVGLVHIYTSCLFLLNILLYLLINKVSVLEQFSIKSGVYTIITCRILAINFLGLPSKSEKKSKRSMKHESCLNCNR